MPFLFQVLHAAVARFYGPWGAHLVAAEPSLSHATAGELGHNWQVSWTQHVSVATDLPALSRFPLCVELLSSSLRVGPAQGTLVFLFSAAISREKGKGLISSLK